MWADHGLKTFDVFVHMLSSGASHTHANVLRIFLRRTCKGVCSSGLAGVLRAGGKGYRKCSAVL